MKLARWFFLTLAVVLAGALLVLEIGATLPLDYQRGYSGSAGALPPIAESGGAGLVQIPAGGFSFRARIAGFGPGAESRPAVILLHGFPVTSAMWEPLIPALAAAGYRVLAIDQRGYSPGARPADVADYSIDKLSDDVIAIAAAAGLDRFHLVGHDWGSIVGWATVMRHPGRVISWSGLSIPHPAAFTEAVENDPDQQARSSYFLFFSAPWLPETLFSIRDFAMLRGFYEGRPVDERQEYLAMFAEPGALRAALNWYRAMTLSQRSTELATQVTTPTLFIWGNRDPSVGRVAVENQARYIDGPYRELELDASHWLLLEQPDTVTGAVLAQLTETE